MNQNVQSPTYIDTAWSLFYVYAYTHDGTWNLMQSSDELRIMLDP